MIRLGRLLKAGRSAGLSRHCLADWTLHLQCGECAQMGQDARTPGPKPFPSSRLPPSNRCLTGTPAHPTLASNFGQVLRAARDGGENPDVAKLSQACNSRRPIRAVVYAIGLHSVSHPCSHHRGPNIPDKTTPFETAYPSRPHASAWRRLLLLASSPSICFFDALVCYCTVSNRASEAVHPTNAVALPWSIVTCIVFA